MKIALIKPENAEDIASHLLRPCNGQANQFHTALFLTQGHFRSYMIRKHAGALQVRRRCVAGASQARRRSVAGASQLREQEESRSSVKTMSPNSPADLKSFGSGVEKLSR
jgi:hypothetical protein